MTSELNINHIMTEINGLDYSGKLNILSHIVATLQKNDSNSTVSLTSLKGLGKELWNRTDVDSYIEKERKSWD